MITVGERVTAYLAGQDRPRSMDEILNGALVGRTAAYAHLGALEEAGRLRVTRPGRALMYQLIPAGVTRPVLIDANDLDLLLGHYYDEVLGTPDRSHWTFPLLRQAADRLAAATRPPDAEAHPVIIRKGET